MEAWSRMLLLSSPPAMETAFCDKQGAEFMSIRCLQKWTEVSQGLLPSGHVPNKDHFPERLVKLAFAYWLASEITAWGRRRRRRKRGSVLFSQDLFSVESMVIKSFLLQELHYGGKIPLTVKAGFATLSRVCSTQMM